MASSKLVVERKKEEEKMGLIVSFLIGRFVLLSFHRVENLRIKRPILEGTISVMIQNEKNDQSFVN